MKMPTHLKLKNEVDHKRTKAIAVDYNTRKKAYEELKTLRQDLKNRREEKVEQFKKERKRLNDNKKRKEINDLKSGTFQVIKNMGKTKKWKVKARKLLQKVPPEVFYNNMARK